MKSLPPTWTAGYLRKNGVPYSNQAAVTEYIDVLNDPNGNGKQWLIVKAIVEDPTLSARARLHQWILPARSPFPADESQ